MRIRVAFLGGARYSRPVDQTGEKKFRLLAELGDVFVIGFSHTLRPSRFTQHAHFYLLPQFPAAVLRYAAMFTVGPLLALWLIWRHGVRILAAQSPYEGFAAGLAKVVAGRLGRRVALVVESHGAFEESLFLQRRVLFPGLYHFLMRRAARFGLKHADALRAISNSTRAQLERWAPGKPLVQFPTWTDLEAFLKAGVEVGKEGRTVLYVGVFTPLKGVHFLLDAFARIGEEFPDARLLVIGKAENPSYASDLRKQAERLGLDGRFAFLDAMPQGELARYMARAQVLVLPSLSEGLGRVVFEAMACGTPVIGSRVDGIPELIEEGKTGFLVPPGDVEALTERLRWVLNHPEEAYAMGQRARDFARRFFSAEAYREHYARLFALADGRIHEERHATASV